MKKRFLIILMFVLLCIYLIGCSKEKYQPIIIDDSLAITVNIKDMTISFINIDAGEKIGEWEVNRPYLGGVILPDGDSLLLYGKQIEEIDIYSLKKGEKIDSWKTGSGIVNGLLLHNENELAFVDQSQNSLRFFSLNGEELGVVKMDPKPLTLLENHKKELYVISYNSQSMTVVNTATKKKTASFSIHPSATGAILREGKNEMWIGGHGEGAELETNIHVYDTTTGQLLKTIHAPVMPINFAQKDEFMYVLSHGSNTLYKLDGEGHIQESAKVGANPFEMKMMDPYILIAGYDSNDISFVNNQSLNVEKTITVGKGPFQLLVRE